jgi:cytochrome bd-type quinol oxidase subunit 2
MSASETQPVESRRGDASAERIGQRVAVLLGVIAVSLAVASTLHLSGRVDGRGAPFDADDAGVAEALIAVVLALAAIALWHGGSRVRRIGLWASGFAIAGFCWGLSVTARGGHWPDIGYHAAVLPLLVTSFVELLRAGRVASSP